MCPPMWAHWRHSNNIHATWWIQLSSPSVVAMRSYVSLLWPLVSNIYRVFVSNSNVCILPAVNLANGLSGLLVPQHEKRSVDDTKAFQETVLFVFLLRICSTFCNMLPHICLYDGHEIQLYLCRHKVWSLGSTFQHCPLPMWHMIRDWWC